MWSVALVLLLKLWSLAFRGFLQQLLLDQMAEDFWFLLWWVQQFGFQSTLTPYISSSEAVVQVSGMPPNLLCNHKL